jgi:hypothetical protein
MAEARSERERATHEAALERARKAVENAQAELSKVSERIQAAPPPKPKGNGKPVTPAALVRAQAALDRAQAKLSAAQAAHADAAPRAEHAKQEHEPVSKALAGTEAAAQAAATAARNAQAEAQKVRAAGGGVASVKAQNARGEKELARLKVESEDATKQLEAVRMRISQVKTAQGSAAATPATDKPAASTAPADKGAAAQPAMAHPQPTIPTVKPVK